MKTNSIMSLKKTVLLGLVFLASTVAHAVSDKTMAEIEERIKPAGSVCLEGDAGCGVSSAAASSGPKSAEDIYNTSCAACHGMGVAGAPKLGAPADWTARLDAGIETVYSNAINGKGGMPPKGTCMSCSDDEIKATVDYMVENSK